MSRFCRAVCGGVAATIGSRRVGRLASAAILFSVALLLSRFLGVVRQVAIADVFGDQGPINAYFAAFRIPDTMFTLVSGNALVAAFIPVLAGLLEGDRKREAWEVTSSVLNTVVIALAGMALFAFVFAPQLMDLLVGYPAGQRALTVDLTRIMLLQPIFLGAAAVVSAVLQSYRRFLLMAIAPLVYNISVIVGALLGHRYGVTGLAWFVVLGAVGQFAIQLPGIASEVRNRFRFALLWDLPAAREVRQLFVPRVIGLGAFQAMLFITLYLASRLPSGMVGAINYAWLLIAFPVGALGTAVATATFAELSRLSATEQVNTMRRTINRSLRMVLLLAIPAAVGLMVLRRPIVNLLYHHGNFTSGDVELTTYALLFYAMAVAQLAVIEILPRAFYAMRDTRTPVRIAVVAVALDAALSIIFVRLFPRNSGQGGLALATALATSVQAIWLAVALDRELGGIGRSSLLATFRDALIASFAMGVTLYVLLTPLAAILPQAGIGAFVTVAFEIAVGLAVVVTVLRYLGAPELWELRSYLPVSLGGARGKPQR
jgi:putative peptidoglycan lipid II flippase